MTVESSLSKVVFNGNGVTTEFPFTFKVWDVSEIAVTMANPQGYAEDVTAAAIITLDEDSGGAVTYLHEGAPLPEGWRLAITRNMPFLQRVDLISATRFDPQVMEDALDQACAERQELREQLARAVIMPPTSETTPEEVVQSVYDARDAAAASATAASGSASEASDSAALAQAWAQSPTPPDAEDADSKSARTWAGLAADSADDAAASESNAAGSADRAQAWAESPAPPDPEDPDSKSAKEWALVAADNVPIATTLIPGKVKPDGASIEVAQDGTISVPLASTAKPGLVKPDGTTITVDAAGKISAAIIGQYYWFEDEMPRPGFFRLLGGTVPNFADTYPEAAAYFRTTYGAARLVASQAEYDALHTAVYYTNADGETEGWNGIGGVNKFFWDTLNDTLTLPDLAGMSPEQIGSDGLGVGGVREDRMRNVTGTFLGTSSVASYILFFSTNKTLNGTSGAFHVPASGENNWAFHVSDSRYGTQPNGKMTFNISRVVPAGPHVSPRAYGSLLCVYLGQPAS